MKFKKCPPEKTLAKRLSSTRMNTFFTCPRRYQHVIEHHSGLLEETEAMRLGKFVHAIIEEIIKTWDGMDWNEIDVRNHAAETALQQVKSSDFFDKEREIMGMIEKFADWEMSWKLLSSQSIHAELVLECPRFYGIVDAYDEDKKLAIDWKTGRFPKKPDEELKLLRQGAVYFHLLWENDLPVHDFKFAFLKEGKIYPFELNRIIEITGKDYDSVYQFVDETIEIINFFTKNGNFMPVDEVGMAMTCFFCPFQPRCHLQALDEGVFLEKLKMRSVETGWLMKNI